jgi:type-F conjugative transfer system pilin assembly protein TrbC
MLFALTLVGVFVLGTSGKGEETLSWTTQRPTEEHRAQAHAMLEQAQTLTARGLQESQKALEPALGCPSSRSPQTCRKKVKDSSLKTDKTPSFPKGHALRIAVSMSLPKETLKALMTSAKRHGATLVMRGLIHNSFRTTAQRLKDWEGEVVVDPLFFKEYALDRVPTFVWVTPQGYRKLTGNVSVAYALKRLTGEES